MHICTFLFYNHVYSSVNSHKQQKLRKSHRSSVISSDAEGNMTLKSHERTQDGQEFCLVRGNQAWVKAQLMKLLPNRIFYFSVSHFQEPLSGILRTMSTYCMVSMQTWSACCARLASSGQLELGQLLFQSLICRSYFKGLPD